MLIQAVESLITPPIDTCTWAPTPAKFISIFTAAWLQFGLPLFADHTPPVVGNTAPPVQLAQIA